MPRDQSRSGASSIGSSSADAALALGDEVDAHRMRVDLERVHGDADTRLQHHLPPVAFPGHDKSALNGQKQHWDGMLASRAEMFGSEPSEAAHRAADDFDRNDVQRVLELGGGQGRDSLFFARRGFSVRVLDYAQAGVEAIQAKARDAGLADRLTAAQHDVRAPLPFENASFDACYSHMLFCMALAEAELRALSNEVLRVLRPGGLNVFTVRNTSDPDYRRGIHRGEDLYENQGFVVQFFDPQKVERIAAGFELLAVEEFEEGKLPRRLFRVTLRKPAR